jgi:aryl-alcohol dehydrogenase-like predicted oxidoreductase
MIAKKLFGRTGHESTRTLFGAAALGKVTQKEADETLEVLFEYGVNHIDTAASYGDSELRIGPWMKQHRDKFFLATKTGERTYDKAKEELHNSLKRLQVDQIDLWQMHYLVKPEEWDVAMGPGGALEAFVEAREQGLVRFLGVTGHDVAIAKMHLGSVDRFAFDSVLLPYNFPMMQNPEYATNLNALLKICAEKQIAVQTIKGITRGPWGDKAKTHNTWYQPLEAQGDIDKAVHWVLGNEQVFLNTAGDIHLLPKILNAASRFERRPTDAEMQATVEALAMEPLFV